MNAKTVFFGLGLLSWLFAQVVNHATTLNDGLVAFYPFNGNANDESGNHNDGKNSHATLTTDRFARPDSAYSFDHAGLSAITATIPQLPTGQAPRTISFWYKTDPSTGRNQAFFGYGRPPQTTGSLFSLLIAGGYVLFLFGSDSDYHDDLHWQKYDDGKWHQMVLVLSANFVKGYFDGQTINWNAFPPPGTVLNTTASDFSIGAFGDAYFDGALDEFRIYNRSLSPDEVEALYDYESNTSGLPRITAEPQDAEILQGKTATFTVESASDTPTVFQWKLSGAPIIRAMSPSLVISNVNFSNRPMHLTLVTQRLVASLPLNTPPVGAICRPQESTG